jgi:catechol 2,3-dioxygenase-like lactoylglutathione lyase family enzyme
MRARHIGLVCRREEQADRFFVDFLGLEKSDKRTIPASLSRPLFGIDTALEVANYFGGGIHFEVFLRDDPQETPSRFGHVCLEIDGLDAFLERARNMNVTVLRVPKGEGWVTFIEDYDGHRFEVKQAGA